MLGKSSGVIVEESSTTEVAVPVKSWSKVSGRVVR